ncbi:MAG: DNA repair protein RecN [Planctomycetota bacterium]
MLLELRVHNVVIIDQACLQPEAGLCVISGETGAGKSLLLDALALVRGERAAAALVGPADEEARVSAVIQIDRTTAALLQEEHGIACPDDQVILRRRVQRSGRSQAWINDEPVGIGVLRSVGTRLIDIRSQNEHLRLSEPARQRECLDAFAGLQELAARERRVRRSCAELEAELQHLDEGEADSLKERDFTRFLLDEIAALEPRSGELDQLQERQELLAGAEDWRQRAAAVAGALQESDDNAAERVGWCERQLQEAPDAGLRGAAEQLAQARELIAEAALACVHAVEGIEVDGAELERVEQRLQDYLDLVRKHGGTETALLAEWERLDARHAELSSLDHRRAAVQEELARLRQEHTQLVHELRRKRKRAFKPLATAVHAALAELGMPRARLSLHEDPGEGADVHEWYCCTNPGLQAGPLRTVVSGGEAARLALALASATAAHDATPVLVFDEVDSGVGGRLGLAIAARLRDLAQDRSVLAITHTPQVAARADRHYRVRKEHGADATAIRVETMDGEERITELADMLGGGSAARDQAQSLLEVQNA